MHVQLQYRQTFIALFAIVYVMIASQGFAYPAKEMGGQNSEAVDFPLSLFGYSNHALLPDRDTQPDRPKNCFHFYVSRNMSSLLSDATKMLRQVHDKQERDWILTFIYRIKSLAEHLRSHPDSQNYEECMGVQDDYKSSASSESMRVPQQELYFVDDMMPNQSQKRSAVDAESADSNGAADTDKEATAEEDKDEKTVSELKALDGETQDNQSQKVSQDNKVSNSSPHQDLGNNFNSPAESTSESLSLKKDVDNQHPSETSSTTAGTSELKDDSSQQQKESASVEEEDWMVGKGGDDSAIIVSSPDPDCLTQVKCKEMMKQMEKQAAENRGDEDELERQLHARRRKNAEEERQHQELLKERIRKALLEELAPEFKKLRTVGGTEKDLITLWKQSEKAVKEEENHHDDNDFDYEEEGAAAGDLVSNDKTSPNYRTVAPSNDQVGNYKKSTEDLPYDHNDVLVQQLYDAARDTEPQYRSTRSLDSQDEYLIISTHIPY